MVWLQRMLQTGSQEQMLGVRQFLIHADISLFYFMVVSCLSFLLLWNRPKSGWPESIWVLPWLAVTGSTCNVLRTEDRLPLPAG